MLRNLSLIAFICITGFATIACGPAQETDEADAIDASDEASEFRKSANGVWKSPCLTFTENANLRSEKRNIQVADSSVLVQIQSFENGLCRGSASKTEATEYKMKVRDASTASHVILELTNKAQTEAHIYRQTVETTLSRVGDRTMTTKIIGLSVWENGQEVFLNENDFGANREVVYKR